MKLRPGTNHVVEFILVFAAVALGFFAENLREHYSDRAREREFVRSLVSNLKADSVIYAQRDSASRQRVVWMDTLISVLTQKQKNRNAEMYQLARYSTRIVQARPGLSTINFLSKNNDYSLIDDIDVKNIIQRHEARLTWLQTLTDLEEGMIKDIWILIPRIFDTKVFLTMKNVNGVSFERPLGNPSLLTSDPIVINELAYHLYLRRSQFNSELYSQAQVQIECRDLIRFLEGKYELN